MPTLDWLNRATAFSTAARVPYRLLKQVSVHTPLAPSPLQGEGGGEGPPPIPMHDNLLIQSDNLEALEALEALLPFYRGQVKCIFIDPPDVVFQWQPRVIGQTRCMSSLRQTGRNIRPQQDGATQLSNPNT